MKDASKENSTFWDEMCGTAFAQAMNVKDFSIHELMKYDHFFFNHYPYLQNYFPPYRLKNLNVVEFGLGYGSLSEYLAKNSKSYKGIDIAEGPVKLVQHRITQNNLTSKAAAEIGNSLRMPLKDSSVDLVVAIGCFHHTGDFKKCIDETHRVLVPGGEAILMVYNRYSLRRWLHWPVSNLKHFFFGEKSKVSVAERASYDVNSAGEAAPETEFYSKNEIREICKDFDVVLIETQNVDNSTKRGRREAFLPTLGQTLGLDLYFVLRKKEQ